VSHAFRATRWRDTAASLIVLAALIGLWWLAAHGQWVNKAFLPTPEAAVLQLVSGLLQGDLAAHTAATVGRMLAGWLLASAQGAGLLGRLGWGLVATWLRSARAVLVMAGGGMAICALVLGLWGPLLNGPILVLLSLVFGLTASGWNGVFIAEIANLAAPERVAEATGAVLTASFLGLVMAPLVVALLTPRVGLGGSFVALGVMSAVGAIVLLMERPHARK
jgi:hypothetical protein